MAQIFDGKETPIRQAFSRIAWKIEGSEFKGNCPNDPLFRAFFSSPGQESGEFNYKCGKADKRIEWELSEDKSKVFLSMKIDEQQKSNFPPEIFTPKAQALAQVNWHLKGEAIVGYVEDNDLFRSVFDSNSGDVYSGEGELIYQLPETAKNISWFRKDRVDLYTGEPLPENLILVLPLYDEPLEVNIALNDRELEDYLEKFNNYLHSENLPFNSRSIEHFLYFAAARGEITAEQDNQLRNYFQEKSKLPKFEAEAPPPPKKQEFSNKYENDISSFLSDRDLENATKLLALGVDIYNKIPESKKKTINNSITQFQGKVYTLSFNFRENKFDIARNDRGTMLSADLTENPNKIVVHSPIASSDLKVFGAKNSALEKQFKKQQQKPQDIER